MINTMIDSAVIQLDIAECSDVVALLQERGIELIYSVEKDGVYIYGTQDLVDQADDILWARQEDHEASDSGKETEGTRGQGKRKVLGVQ